MEMTRNLVYITWESNGYGVFVTRDRFQRLINFYFARWNSKTWSEFWFTLDLETRDYVEMFMDCDDYEPAMEDRLADIASEVWVLHDLEFPITQCVEETTFALNDGFLAEFCVDTIRTEYGHAIDLYALDKNEEIVVAALKLGVTVEAMESPFPCHLCHYG